MKYLLPLIIFFSFSCSLLEKNDEEGVLAKVYDKYLYKKDIEDLLLKLQGNKDSAVIVTNYINNWVQQELLLQKAELNLREDQKDFSKLLEDYRKSLIIYAYQKEYIRHTLDTNVTDEEVSSYYDKNQANFELKKNIVKMRFAQVFKTAPKLNDLNQLIQSEDPGDKLAFRDYCLQYAVDFNDNDTTWVVFDKVKEKIPVAINDEEDFLKRHRFFVNADSASYYLLYISEYKIKNGISPLSFEHEKIRNIIINQRKLELMSAMKKDLFETALQKGNAEIYQN